MNQSKSRFFILLTLLFAHFAVALPTDKNQPIHLVADKGHLNKATGISVFTGHVQLTQGTGILLADTLTLHTDKKNQLIEADAQGNLANFSNLPQLNKPRFVAVAETIQYFPAQSEIILIGNAKATQGPNSYTAPRIEYYVDQQMVVSPASSQGRTTIVIQPKSLQSPKSKTS